MSRLPLPLSLRPFLPGRQSEGGRLLNNNPGMVLIIAGSVVAQAGQSRLLKCFKRR